MRVFKKILVMTLVMLMVLTSIPLQAFASKEESEQKETSTEIIKVEEEFNEEEDEEMEVEMDIPLQPESKPEIKPNFIEKIIKDFTSNIGFLSNMKEVFLEKEERGSQCKVVIRIVDRDKPKIGIEDATLRIVDKDTDEIVAISKTDPDGIAMLNLDKGRYYVEQVKTEPGYTCFEGKLDFHIWSVEWAKLIRLENISEKSLEKNLKYEFKALDKKGDPVSGVKIRVKDINDTAFWIEKTTDKDGLAIIEYLKTGEASIAYLNNKTQYKTEILDLPNKYKKDIAIENFEFGENEEGLTYQTVEQVVNLE